jgi:hypothetical protein
VQKNIDEDKIVYVVFGQEPFGEDLFPINLKLFKDYYKALEYYITLGSQMLDRTTPFESAIEMELYYENEAVPFYVFMEEATIEDL